LREIETEFNELIAGAVYSRKMWPAGYALKCRLKNLIDTSKTDAWIPREEAGLSG
jgi:hypothetical protein